IMLMFTWPIISFVLVMLFVVRPLSIWLPTIGTELTLQERTLIGWIAPRGIVALTVAGYFAKNLLNDGYDDAAILMTLTFALVFITVCAHGFTLRSEEHTSELQSRFDLVCRLLLEKKKPNHLT